MASAEHLRCLDFYRIGLRCVARHDIVYYGIFTSVERCQRVVVVLAPVDSDGDGRVRCRRSSRQRHQRRVVKLDAVTCGIAVEIDKIMSVDFYLKCR